MAASGLRAPAGDPGLFFRADSAADMSPVYPGRHAFDHTSAVFVAR